MVSFRRCLMALMICAVAFAVDVPRFQQFFYTGGNIQYVCEAPANVAKTTVSVAAGTMTNISVSSNVGTVIVVGHGLWVGARVTVSGSSTTALNGTYTVQTVIDANSYTITTAAVSDATYTTGLTVSTNAPLLTSAIWSVTVYNYISGVLDNVHLGGGALSMNFKAACSDRTSY